VDEDILDLAKDFLENRRGAAREARAAIAVKDWALLRRIGHELKGTAGSFGFRELSAIGVDLEHAALTRDPFQARDAVDRMARYVDRVTVVPLRSTPGS
jgi:HPt (histidine-containing phosphotransfer) domain-containing protein